MLKTNDWQKKILAQIMLNNSLLYHPSFSALRAEDFPDDKCMAIFAAMKCIHREGKEIDLINTVERLDFYGELERVGGPDFVCSLVDYID